MRAITVVGASLAGWRAAQELRNQGFGGRINLVGAEASPPYDRPPLSKKFLEGRVDAADLALTDEDERSLVDATWYLGRAATKLDTSGGVVELDDGTRLRTDGVVIATGGRPKTLPHTPAGVHTLRTLDDALALRADLRPAARVVVVGGSFLGAEIASTCSTLGLEVTVIEAFHVPLARVFGTELGSVCGALHTDHGVGLLCGTRVRRLFGKHRVTGVELVDGRALPADVVVLGVGMTPNTEWLDGSGIALSDGVLCDSGCVTGLPNVVAVGDVARCGDAVGGKRFEHWTTALEQPTTAIRNLLAGSTVQHFSGVPYFWSEQYGVRIQFTGHAKADDEIRIVDGSPDDRHFVATYQRNGTVTGVMGMDSPKLFTKFRRQLAAGSTAPVC